VIADRTTAPLAVTGSPEQLTVNDVRDQLRAWMAANSDTLRPLGQPSGDANSVFESLSQLQRVLYDAGWIRLGWPQDFGGLGGTIVLRAVVSEELAAAGYPPPFSFGTQEVLGPAVARFAAPELAAQVLPRLLRGEETWAQGFSEPGAGSDLASLRVRADDDGDNWRINGEKIWTSWAQFADRCFLLARTGTRESAHRGITAMLLDMDTPGLQVRPLVSMNGDAEFCSLVFEDVIVPKSRIVGEVGGGWAVAMFVLSCERGPATWQRQAWMRWRLARLVAATDAVPDATVGESAELIYALRLLSRRTVRALSEGRDLGVLPSFDKLTMSTAEKFLFDAALAAMPDQVAFDPNDSELWRNDYLYSRAASIYGGAAEIQRNIIAERILALPRG
jgi:alkylation response protein AidB-like acyl-CoA dehydrogenase